MGATTGSEITALQALMHLLKAYIGTGILAMPKAFSYSGIVVGLIGTPIIGLLCHFCIHQLVEINEHLMSQQITVRPLDFEDLAETVFKEGPKGLRKYAKVSRFITMLFLFLTQIGFSCAYYLFVANNIRQFFVNLEVGQSISIQLYLVIILPFMIGITFIKNIKHLSNASMIANVVQLASFAIIIYNLVTNVDQNGSIAERRLFGNKLPEFFNTTIFTYEGITVSMALYRSMKNRKNFAKTFGVINAAISIVICLYSLVGILGYLKYGDGVEASITLSLPNENLYLSVQIMYSLAISVSYGVQLYVAIHLIWPIIDNKLQDYKLRRLYIELIDCLFRTILVLLTFILAYIIPELDLILSLIGAVSCSTVAIILPPILHTITFYPITTKFYPKLWLIFRNGLIMTLGLIGFIVGTYYSIYDISQEMS